MAASNARLWFLIHGWLALPVWLLFAFVCLTGTIACVSHEITWLLNPAARAANPDGQAPRPLPELLAAVERAAPGAEIGHIVNLEPYLVTVVGFSSKQLPNARAYVNPYTAEVQAIEQGITFIEFMRSLHGWLLFPWQHSYSIGYYLVGALSLLVLGALGTGVVVYKRFWRAYTQPRLRLDRGARVLFGDVHRLAGAWSLWFLLLIGLTGLWYLTQGVLWHNGIDVDGEPPVVAQASVPLGVEAASRPVSLASAVDIARQALPSLEPSWIAQPEHNRDHYSIAGGGEAWWFDRYSYRVFVDPWSGKVAEIRQPATMDALQTISHLADPLHYGTLGGLWTKLIWFVFGAMLSAMSVTGFLIWSKRTLKGAERREGDD